MRSRLAIGLASALLLFASPRRSEAANEDDFFPGHRAAMTGGAVTATVDDGSAVYFNPAGLAKSPGSRLDVSASAYALRYMSVPAFIRSPSGARQDASVDEFLTIPTQIAYVRRLSPDVVLGLGYFVPRNQNSLLRARLIDPRADGQSTFALDNRTTATSFLLAAALGFRASEHVRWGFGLFVGYENVVQSTGFFGSDQRLDVIERVTQLSTLSTFTRISGHVRGGVQIDLSPKVTLGIAARGPRLQFNRSGEDSINVSTVFAPPAGDGRPEAFSNLIEDTGSQFGLLEWGRYHAALAYDLDRVVLSAEIDVQPGLRSHATDVNRKTAVNGRLGAIYPISDTFVIGSGVFTDRATDGGASYADFVGVTAGIEMNDLVRLAVSERAPLLVLSTVFALRYAHGSGPTFPLRAERDTTVVQGTAPSTMSVNEVGLHVGSTLRF